MLKTVIAAAFKSKGVRKISKSELCYTLSFDLKWFTHEKSQQVVDIAIDKALLVEEDGVLTPTFKIEEVEIPFGFKPELKRIVSSSPLDDIIWEVCERTGKDASEITAVINNLQNKLGDLLDAEVVALIIARNHGIDISSYIDKVWEDVIY